MSTPATLLIDSGRSVAARLNRECFCITLDRDALLRAFDEHSGDPEVGRTLLEARPHLFSGSQVFLSRFDVERMMRAVRAIEAAARLPEYREAVLSWAPSIAYRDYGPRGAFMSYDFHLTEQGPRLIEVNTNAGGAFLNALLLRAQAACCPEVRAALGLSRAAHFDAAVVSMFEAEWRLQRASGRLRRIAIIDDAPSDQYLYPEFVLARRLLQRNGVDAIIADAASLRYEAGQLHSEGAVIDLVYNRLVDFPLEEASHEALRSAYVDGAVVVTPNPRVHALLANKRNLTVLTDRAALASAGLTGETLDELSCVPRTVLVTAENASDLWKRRKSLFFKPVGGYGSKAVYRGDKVTKGAWATIIAGGFVAQELAPPSERYVLTDKSPEPRKTDVRLYVYDGNLLLAAARLYQGQATNFRTPGGGFAPVLPL